MNTPNKTLDCNYNFQGGEDEVDCQFSTQQLRSLESSQFKADDVQPQQTTTMESKITTIFDTTILPEHSSSTNPLPETTLEIKSSATSPTTLSTDTTIETLIETETVPETTKTTIITSTTAAASTILTTTNIDETTTPFLKSSSITTPSSTTSTSTISSTTSRDGRQLIVTTAAPVTESTKFTNDSGRFLFPRLSSTTTSSLVVSSTITPTQLTTQGFVPIRVDSTTKKAINNALTIDVNKGDSFHCKK